MKDLDDFIAKLDEADEEDRQEIREHSNNLRKLANLLDEIIKEGISAEEIEEIMGKIIVIVIKLKGLI